MSGWEQSLLAGAIKYQLKRQKITYQELGTRLHLSEATVKRMLSTGNCSLDRLVSICRELDLSLFDLVTSAHLRPAKLYQLDEVQDDFFAKHPHYYWFLHRLIRGIPLERISRESGLGERSALHYLRTLEKWSLLDLGPRMRFRFRLAGVPQWVEHGAMIRAHLLPNVLEFLRWLFSQGNGPMRRYDSAHRSVSTRTARLMLADLEELIAKYNRLSAQDTALCEPADLITMRWVFGLAQFDENWEKMIPTV